MAGIDIGLHLLLSVVGCHHRGLGSVRLAWLCRGKKRVHHDRLVVRSTVAVAHADVEGVVRALLLLLLVLHLSGYLDLRDGAVRALLDVLGGLLSASA